VRDKIGVITTPSFPPLRQPTSRKKKKIVRRCLGRLLRTRKNLRVLNASRVFRVFQRSVVVSAFRFRFFVSSVTRPLYSARRSFRARGQNGRTFTFRATKFARERNARLSHEVNRHDPRSFRGKGRVIDERFGPPYRRTTVTINENVLMIKEKTAGDAVDVRTRGGRWS